MTVWIVLGCILLALVLISLIRVGGDAEYGEDGLAVRLRLGIFRFVIWPMKKKKKSKKAKAQKKESKVAPKEESESKSGGSLTALKAYLPLVTDAAGRFKRKVRIDDIRLDLTAAASDPAEAAMLFGGANVVIGMIWPLFEHNFNIKKQRIRTRVDLQAKEPTVYLFAAFSMTIGQGVALTLRLLVRFLKIYSQTKATQKEAI